MWQLMKHFADKTVTVGVNERLKQLQNGLQMQNLSLSTVWEWLHEMEFWVSENEYDAKTLIKKLCRIHKETNEENYQDLLKLFIHNIAIRHAGKKYIVRPVYKTTFFDPYLKKMVSFTDIYNQTANTSIFSISAMLRIFTVFLTLTTLLPSPVSAGATMENDDFHVDDNDAVSVNTFESNERNTPASNSIEEKKTNPVKFNTIDLIHRSYSANPDITLNEGVIDLLRANIQGKSNDYFSRFIILKSVYDGRLRQHYAGELVALAESILKKTTPNNFNHQKIQLIIAKIGLKHYTSELSANMPINKDLVDLPLYELENPISLGKIIVLLKTLAGSDNPLYKDEASKILLHMYQSRMIYFGNDEVIQLMSVVPGDAEAFKQKLKIIPELITDNAPHIPADLKQHLLNERSKYQLGSYKYAHLNEMLKVTPKDGHSIDMLADMFLHGRGVPKDREIAKKWMLYGRSRGFLFNSVVLLKEFPEILSDAEVDIIWTHGSKNHYIDIYHFRLQHLLIKRSTNKPVKNDVYDEIKTYAQFINDKKLIIFPNFYDNLRKLINYAELPVLWSDLNKKQKGLKMVTVAQMHLINDNPAKAFSYLYFAREIEGVTDTTLLELIENLFNTIDVNNVSVWEEMHSKASTHMHLVDKNIAFQLLRWILETPCPAIAECRKIKKKSEQLLDQLIVDKPLNLKAYLLKLELLDTAGNLSLANDLLNPSEIIDVSNLSDEEKQRLQYFQRLFHQMRSESEVEKDKGFDWGNVFRVELTPINVFLAGAVVGFREPLIMAANVFYAYSLSALKRLVQSPEAQMPTVLPEPIRRRHRNHHKTENNATQSQDQINSQDTDNTLDENEILYKNQEAIIVNLKAAKKIIEEDLRPNYSRYISIGNYINNKPISNRAKIKCNHLDNFLSEQDTKAKHLLTSIVEYLKANLNIQDNASELQKSIDDGNGLVSIFKSLPAKVKETTAYKDMEKLVNSEPGSLIEEAENAVPLTAYSATKDKESDESNEVKFFSSAAKNLEPMPMAKTKHRKKKKIANIQFPVTSDLVPTLATPVKLEKLEVEKINRTEISSSSTSTSIIAAVYHQSENKRATPKGELTRIDQEKDKYISSIWRILTDFRNHDLDPTTILDRQTVILALLYNISRLAVITIEDLKRKQISIASLSAFRNNLLHVSKKNDPNDTRVIDFADALMANNNILIDQSLQSSKLFIELSNAKQIVSDENRQFELGFGFVADNLDLLIRNVNQVLHQKKISIEALTQDDLVTFLSSNVDCCDAIKMMICNIGESTACLSKSFPAIFNTSVKNDANADIVRNYGSFRSFLEKCKHQRNPISHKIFTNVDLRKLSTLVLESYRFDSKMRETFKNDVKPYTTPFNYRLHSLTFKPGANFSGPSQSSTSTRGYTIS